MIKVIYGYELRRVIEEANHLGLTKEDIISLISKDNEVYLIYDDRS